MACGWRQMLVEDIGRMQVNTEEQGYSLEVALRAIDVCWKPTNPTIDFH